MMIWINGAFGAGKTTLADELHRRLPDALAFDPEYVLGHILARWVPSAPSGDFQDIPLWRKLGLAEFAIGMAAEYGQPMIIPMTLVNPVYRDETSGPSPRPAKGCCNVLSSRCRPMNCAVGSTPRSCPRMRRSMRRLARSGTTMSSVASRPATNFPISTLILRGDQHTPGARRPGPGRVPFVGVTGAAGDWQSWKWDESLFAGAAEYYEQGRLPYAPGLADAVAGELALDGQGQAA